MLLPVTPQIFDRIQLRHVSGQELDFQSFSFLDQEILHHPAAMGGQPVPNHQQLAPQVLQQMLQELHHLGTSDSAGEQAKVEVPPRHPRRCRKQIPVEVILQHGSLTSRRPRPAAMRPLAQPAFVDKDDGLVTFSGFFLSSGQRFFFQRRMATSSRSKARPTGRWQLHCNCRRIRQAWTIVYRTPDTCSINSTTRRAVHKPVAYPRASGPRLSPASIWCRSEASSWGLRPARPALRNAEGPNSANCRCQRFTDCRWTPTRRATSASDSPLASRRAACRRRRSNALKSRFTPAGFPMPESIQENSTNVTISCNYQIGD